MRHGKRSTRSCARLAILSLSCATLSAWPTLADESDTDVPVEAEAATTPPEERDWRALYKRCEEIALGVGHNLETCEAQLESNNRLCESRLEITQRAAADAATIRLQGAEARIKVLEAALEAAEERADREVWEHPGWWFAGGAVTGLAVATAVVYGGVWAVGQLRPAIPPAE